MPCDRNIVCVLGSFRYKCGQLKFVIFLTVFLCVLNLYLQNFWLNILYLKYFNIYVDLIHYIMQRHVVDFYISDFQSGLRALVKTGYGARVTPYVDDSIVIDVSPDNKDMSPEFLRWLRDRNLSSDDRVMQLKEG